MRRSPIVVFGIEVGNNVNWKIKSALQNMIAHLPEKLSYEIYYKMQRRFGSLRRGNYTPKSRLTASVNIWEHILNSGKSGVDKTFFEIGTGRVPITPMALFLMGAKKIITVDLNPYVKGELCQEALAYVCNHKNDIYDVFGEYLVKDNLDLLLNYYAEEKFSVEGFLKLCNISYLAPLDATNTSLPDDTVDYYVSYTVLEHISECVLKGIVNEGNRILANDGLHIHRIDYSDHFSHSDKSISPINFLRFTDQAWKKYAGNRYMYMNRMRHDDFRTLFESSGCKILSESMDCNEQSRELLNKNKLRVNKKFDGKGIQILSATGGWFVLGRS